MPKVETSRLTPEHLTSDGGESSLSSVGSAVCDAVGSVASYVGSLFSSCSNHNQGKNSKMGACTDNDTKALQEAYEAL